MIVGNQYTRDMGEGVKFNPSGFVSSVLAGVDAAQKVANELVAA